MWPSVQCRWSRMTRRQSSPVITPLLNLKSQGGKSVSPLERATVCKLQFHTDRILHDQVTFYRNLCSVSFMLKSSFTLVVWTSFSLTLFTRLKTCHPLWKGPAVLSLLPNRRPSSDHCWAWHLLLWYFKLWLQSLHRQWHLYAWSFLRLVAQKENLNEENATQFLPEYQFYFELILTNCGDGA